MNGKTLFILKLVGAGLTAGATVFSAIIGYKDPNKFSDVLKDLVKTLKN